MIERVIDEDHFGSKIFQKYCKIVWLEGVKVEILVTDCVTYTQTELKISFFKKYYKNCVLLNRESDRFSN